jgi:Dyp-type peroxidase family
MNDTSRGSNPPTDREPVLEMREIQGLVVPGLLKPHQTLLGVRIPGGSREVTLNFKELLCRLVEEEIVTTAEKTLENRKEYREERKREKERHPKNPPRAVFVGVGFSSAGLRKLTPGAQDIPGEAFHQGLARRSALLGDPTDQKKEGHPLRWIVGGPGDELDALFVVAGDDRAETNYLVSKLDSRLQATGVRINYRENGDRRSDLMGHEHFGFFDDVSQPGVRGLTSEEPKEYLTKRRISEDQKPETWLYGRPGEDLVWPGEFILGYPKMSPDPLVPGPSAPAVPEWTRNGSFLVFRRLRQDVGLFWRTMRDEAARLQDLPGFGDMTDMRLAALLVGRWPSGAPVNRVPSGDNKDLGKEDRANNHFLFDSDTSRLPLVDQYSDGFPMAKADPAGLTCPWAAHIRKLNTRDSSSDMGGRDSTYKARILRRGIPFGEPLEDRYADEIGDPEDGNRGLLFLGVQASIESQFEFLMARWINDPTRPKMPGGHDMLIGQNGQPGEERVRRCILFGRDSQHRDLHQAKLEVDKEWVIPTGGGYFYVPSMSALRDVIGG